MMMQLYRGDCLDILPTLPAASVDAVLCDQPFGTTANPWDVPIPPERLWPLLDRVVKPNAPILLFAAQPFTSLLVTSNLPWFKYDLVWDSRRPTGHLNAKKAPLRRHQSVLLFSPGSPAYSPEMRRGSMKKKGGYGHLPNRGVYDAHGANKPASENDSYYPTSIIEGFAREDRKLRHPNQKPVPLLRYLLRTYLPNRGTVLDFTMGGGSCGEAAKLEGCEFIGIERDPDYFAAAQAYLSGLQQEVLL